MASGFSSLAITGIGGWSAASSLDQVLRLDDIFRATHEAQGHKIYSSLDAERQIGAILRGQRRGAHRHTRQVDALVLRQLTTDGDGADDLSGGRGLHLQLNGAVGK